MNQEQKPPIYKATPIQELREIRNAMDRVGNTIATTNTHLRRIEWCLILLLWIAVPWFGLWLLSGFLAIAANY